MKRLIEKMVLRGLVTDWRLATWPTRRSPLLVKATTDGVVRPPSWFGITTACPPSMTETTELVVPKSIPMILLIFPQSSGCDSRRHILACFHYQILVRCCQVSPRVGITLRAKMSADRSGRRARLGRPRPRGLPERQRRA